MPRTGDVLHFELLDLFGELLQGGLLALENTVIRQQGLVQALAGRSLDTATALGLSNVLLPLNVQGLIDLLNLTIKNSNSSCSLIYRVLHLLVDSGMVDLDL